jgi:hypothetical protein
MNNILTSSLDAELAASQGVSVERIVEMRAEALAALRRALVRRGYTCAATLDARALLEFACDMYDAMKESILRKVGG